MRFLMWYHSLVLATAASAELIRYAKPLPDAIAADLSVVKRAQSTEPCAVVSAAWSAAPASATAITVPASVAYQCLQSVPVDVDGDLQEIAELQDILNFQTTIKLLKNGTDDVPPTDILGGLDNIATGVKNGTFKSEFEVQAAITTLLTSVGDNHLAYQADITSIFTFVRLNSTLVSVSKDGVALPDVYLRDDLIRASRLNYTASPIATVNGTNTTQFLDKRAALAGYHDSDARYNALFPNQALASIGSDTGGVFSQSIFYFGEQTTLTFKNGTNSTLKSVALFSAAKDFTNVKDGKSFFAQFCTGPSSTDDSDDSTPTSTPTPSVNATKAKQPVPTGYPKPVFVQSGLALQAYYLNGTGYSDVAVLVIPTYEATLGASTNETDVNVEFQKVLRAFLADAIKQQKKKLIIDLRGNGGGNIVLGFETFKQLFPSIVPYGATRYRAHDAFEIMSSAYADWTSNDTLAQKNPDLYETVIGTAGTFDWTNVLDVNNQNFKSFRDYYGPYTVGGDTFIAPRRYNWSDPYGYPADPFTFNLTGYQSLAKNVPSQPFDASNIVILQDGACSSTCTIFSELMREQGKVQTIAVGGHPVNAPMQGIGGTKGAQVLNMFDIVDMANQITNLTTQVVDVATAKAVNASALGDIGAITQMRTRCAFQSSGALAGSVNSLDNFRQNDTSQRPLQFIYEAADCRIFNTWQSLTDVTNLWKLAADTKWGNGKCVAGSTGAKTAVSTLNNTPFNKNSNSSSNSSSSSLPQQGGASGLKAQYGVGSAAIAAIVAALFVF